MAYCIGDIFLLGTTTALFTFRHTMLCTAPQHHNAVYTHAIASMLLPLHATPTCVQLLLALWPVCGHACVCVYCSWPGLSYLIGAATQRSMRAQLCLLLAEAHWMVRRAACRVAAPCPSLGSLLCRALPRASMVRSEMPSSRHGGAGSCWSICNEAWLSACYQSTCGSALLA